ncbi:MULTISPECIES: hypothetical protein [Streptomyces]|uniref:hypothetical protein n=1 Tax=Streptomyces TaxID=1883 RepID=UPI000BF01EF5|nr:MULTISPECIES: hypothetical protein [unclassified Streptomyces]WTF59824.1 hypothetical protein OH791_01725 [Streptomyces anulatus]
MGTWRDEPGAREWREAADAADRLRGLEVPVRELPGYIQGWTVLMEALQLLAYPEGPGNLTAGRSALRRALGLFPQSVPDQLCHESRWRSRRWGESPLEVCDRRTCGRCLPLKAADCLLDRR